MSEQRVLEIDPKSQRPRGGRATLPNRQCDPAELCCASGRVGIRRGILRLLGFFSFIAITATLLDAFVNHGLRNIRTSKFGSLNRVMSGEANADIIINGSSRALDHYDPRIIKDITGHSAYNIGMNASQIDFQLAVLKAYLNHNSKPRLVIQNLDLFSFETTKAGEIYDPGYYVPFLWDNDIYEGLREIDPSVWKWKKIPLYGYAVEDMRFTWVSGILGCLGVGPKEDYFEGFNPQYRAWTADFDRFRNDRTEGVTYAIEKKGAENLEEIARICRERGIQLLFVCSPEFYEMQALERNRTEIFGKFREIADKFRVPIWDYSDSAICRERQFFYNSQHLNSDGAASFSADLAQRLREFESDGM